MTAARRALIPALLAVYVIWGSTYYAMRIALEGIPPLLMGGIRFVLAGLALYMWLRARGAPAPTWPEWRASAPIGFLLLTIGNGGVALAEGRAVSSSLAALVVATMPLWAVLFASMVGERPSRSEAAGLLLGLVGVALLQAGGDLRGHGFGALFLLVAPVSWALGSVWSRRLSLPKGAMATAVQMLIGGLLMLGLSVGLGEHLTALPSARAVGALLYLMIFGSIVAFTAYGWLLRNASSGVATSYAYVNPVVALGLGVVFGGEKIAWLTVVGAAVVLLGVAAMSLGKASAPAAKET
ncbi:MAG: drug/metabolite exporter YedA [Polyangiaceae bacterium]